MKKKIKYIVIFLVVFLLIYILFSIYQKSQTPVVIYQTVKLENKDIEVKTIATGSVVPRNEIEIKPQAVSGILDKLMVEAGDYVKAGDIIARIKIIPSISSLSNAESRLKVAKTNLEQDETNYERAKELHEAEILSDKDFLLRETAYKNSQSDYQNALDNYEIAKNGVASRFQGEANNTLIRSTIAGMVVDVPIKEGVSVTERNNFNAGTTIAIVADMQDLIFQGNVDEIDVGRLKVGSPVEILIGALPDHSFMATLEYIAPKGSTRNNEVVFEIKAALETQDSVFVRDGYSANGEIILESKTDVPALSEGFISFHNDSAFVDVLTGENPQTFEKRHITLGISDNIFAEILSGLDTNDRIKGYALGSEPAKNRE